MEQNRRAFLRDTIGLGSVPIIGGLAGCARSGESLSDAADINDASDTTPDKSDLNLQSRMQIGIGSTSLAGMAGPGEIDPNEAGGGRLVTVDTVDRDEHVTISWHQTVEREIPVTKTATDVGVDDSTPTPRVEIIKETGTIIANGLDNAHKPYLPMYWQPGEIQTETSAIWLSQEAFQELKETRRTAWSRDVLTRISRVGREAVEQIQSGATDRIRTGVAEVDKVYLHAEPDSVDFDLTVNGENTTVSTIEAYDSFGNGYRILDNEHNPLVMKFTYDSVSVGFTGFDTALWTLIKTIFSGYQVVTIDV